MKPRDLELLSSYLDGQLKPSETARLEARLTSDADLRAVLDDLRSARGLLRGLPMRKAPRNFTLTPKMVGKNPPLPRSYPAFKFVTTLASLLLFFTLGLNFLVPQMAQSPGFGYGGGGGGGAPEILSEAPAAVPEAATEAPAEASSAQMVPATATLDAADSAAREIQTPMDKQGVTNEADVQPAADQNPASSQPISPAWQIALAVIALIGALIMLMMRTLSAERWRRR